MSGRVYNITGGPRLWYVADQIGDIHFGPFASRDLAEAERRRVMLPLAADGVVFVAEVSEPGVGDVRLVAIGVSLLAAQQALDTHLANRSGVAQIGPWQSMGGWQRDILWQDGNDLFRSWQLVRRVEVRKESK